jgi:LysM repeat protein
MNLAMKTIRKAITLILIIACLGVHAQPGKYTVADYISTYQNTAIQEMELYKIPASVKMAQGILESANGNSILAVNSNNHFGIKCKPEWKGDTYFHDDDEENECFRKYAAVLDSYRDHSLFLTTRSRYAFLFQLDITDYKGWAAGLKQAGYATDPRYPEKIIRIIEENKLYNLDRGKPLVFGQPVRDTTQKLPPPPVRDTATIVVWNDTPDFLAVESPDVARRTEIINGVRYIHARKGDTYYSIADDFGSTARDIASYNDRKRNYSLGTGEIVFVEMKKNKASVEFHVVTAGETMHSVSQEYGIRLRALYRKNRMKPGTEAAAGRKLYLQDRVPAN